MPPRSADAGRVPITRTTCPPAAACWMRWLCATMLVLGIALPSHARESDFSQPIDVSADRSEFDQRAGTQTLIGNVEIRQGTMRITADRVEIFLEDTKLARIKGTGAPIRFEQENDKGEPVRGEAGQIDYNALDSTLILSGGATFSQPGQRLASERISVDARTQRVSAEGGPADNANQGRVTIRLDAPPSGAGQ